MPSAVLIGLFSLPAHAACPQELAVYSELEAPMAIDFVPQVEPNAVATHTFRLIGNGGVVLDGFVIHDGEPGRPWGIVTDNCPEGDVTGEELAACTVWQGVIYAVDEAGNIGPLPPEGADAAPQLLLADFGRQLRRSSAFGPGKVETAPWDVFRFSGCQE